MQALTDIRDSIQLLTFDCYGTLIDWECGIRDALAQYGALSGTAPQTLVEAYIRSEAAVEQEGYRSYREVQALALGSVARSFGFDLPAPQAHVLSDTLPDWPAFADTNDALARLKKRYRLGVLSNIDRDLFARTSRRFEVEFDMVVTAEDVHAYKPAHPHFIRMLQATPGGKRGVLHVAQSLYHDCGPANQLGIAFAWINRYGQARRDGLVVSWEFPTLAALADALGV